MMLSQKIEKEEKASKTAAHEALIGKAGGLFIETRINTSMSEMDFDERMKRIKELREIQEKVNNTQDMACIKGRRDNV